MLARVIHEMKAELFALALQGTVATQMVGAPVQPLLEPERPAGSVTFRYSRQRVISCNAGKILYFRRAPKCKVESRSVPGTARIKLVPLPDVQRKIFGPDKRSRIVVDLQTEDRVA